MSHTPQGAGGVGGLLAVRSENGPTQLPFYDGNGNVVGLASPETGDLTAHYSYGPFGELLQATGPAAAENPFRFSAKYSEDETGLSYYGYRYYDSVTGRWLNRDPLEGVAFKLFRDYDSDELDGSGSLYRFVNNSPQDKIDPDGLHWVSPGAPPPGYCTPPPCSRATCKAACGVTFGATVIWVCDFIPLAIQKAQCKTAALLALTACVYACSGCPNP